LAAGVTLLQVAANPYVTILGPPETASSRLNLTQAFNTLGDTVAPYIGGAFILGKIATLPNAGKLQGAALLAYRTHQASSIKLPFIAIASATLVLALAIALYKFPRLEVTQDFRPGGLDLEKDSIWNHRHLYLGAIAIFIYVGAEVSIGSFLVKYFADPNILGISLENGAKLVTLYWGGMMVGRFIGSAAMRRIAANKILMWAGVGAAFLVFGSLIGHGHFAAIAILSVGLFNSIMFPTIFTLASEGLGPRAADGSGLLCVAIVGGANVPPIMFPTIFTLAVAELGPLTGRGSGLLVQAIVGGAVFPMLMGYLADHYGIHHSLLMPLLCYFFIAYYGWKGYRIQPGEVQSHLEVAKA